MTSYSERRKDLKYIISIKYAAMKRRAVSKKMDICTKEEFKTLAFSSDELKQIHKRWVDSGFNMKKSPSVDRIDNTVGYFIDNIQFITHSENVCKGNSETNRKPPPRMRKRAVVLKKNEENYFFETGKEACDFLGLSRNAVCIAIRDKKLLHGFTVSYA